MKLGQETKLIIICASYFFVRLPAAVASLSLCTITGSSNYIVTASYSHSHPSTDTFCRVNLCIIISITRPCALQECWFARYSQLSSRHTERAIDIISLSALLADSYYGEAAKKWRATHLAEWARGVASSAVMTGQVAFLFGTRLASVTLGF